MRGFLKFLVVLIVIVVIIAGIGYVVLNFGSKVDTEWTQTDLESLIGKTEANADNISDLTIVNIANGKYTVSGSNSVDTSFTDAEISAMVASANDESGPVRDFKIAFTDGDQVEMSFKLSPNVSEMMKEEGFLDTLRVNTPGLIMLSLVKGNVISLTETLVNYLMELVDNKPIYASGTLIKSDSNHVSVDIVTLKVGSLPLPESTIDTVEEKTEIFVNTFITSENGFRIDELRVEDGALYYRGTLPSEIEGIPIE
jgi:hypothetical protein